MVLLQPNPAQTVSAVSLRSATLILHQAATPRPGPVFAHLVAEGALDHKDLLPVLRNLHRAFARLGTSVFPPIQTRNRSSYKLRSASGLIVSK